MGAPAHSESTPKPYSAPDSPNVKSAHEPTRTREHQSNMLLRFALRGANSLLVSRPRDTLHMSKDPARRIVALQGSLSPISYCRLTHVTCGTAHYHRATYTQGKGMATVWKDRK